MLYASKRALASTALERLLNALTRRGPSILAVGVGAGLIWPRLADLVRPAMGSAIFVLLLATMLRLDVSPALEALRRPGPLLAIALFAVVGCPLLAFVLASAAGLPADMTLALVLALAAPPSTGAAALAWMLGLNGALALLVTLMATAMIPFTVTVFTLLTPGLSIDPLPLAMKLTLLVGGATGLAVLIRRRAAGLLVRHRLAIDGLALISLLVFALSAMAGMQAILVREPRAALASVALAFAVNIGQLLLGVLIPGPSARQWTVGLVLGNRNVGLIWSALGASVTPSMALYFAATQLPIYTLPRLLQAVLPRLRDPARRSPRTSPGDSR